MFCVRCFAVKTMLPQTKKEVRQGKNKENILRMHKEQETSTTFGTSSSEGRTTSKNKLPTAANCHHSCHCYGRENDKEG